MVPTTTIFRDAVACLMNSSAGGNDRIGAFVSSRMRVVRVGSSVGLIRPGNGATVLIASAALLKGTPRLTPTASAARTLCTQCVPHSCVYTGCDSPFQWTVNVNLAGQAEQTSVARTIESGPVP